MSKMQTAARRLHALGFKTLPVKPGTKVPSTKHGVKDATMDDAATDAWYAAHPSDGIAVSGEGFVIFDFDVHDGLDGRDALNGWKLPDTMAQTTPSGGYHLFYRADREVRPSVNSSIAVDVRGAGSYVVIDPTPGYALESDDPPADADAAVWAFLEQVRPARADRGTKGLGRKKQAEVVTEGGRNDYLYREGASMRARNESDDMIAATLQALNTVCCRPPLPRAEVDKLTESVLALPSGLSDEAMAAKRPQGRPRKFDHAKVARTLIEERGAAFVDGMPALRDADGGRYRTGWDAFDAAIIDMHDDCTVNNRREVKAYISAKAPRLRQSPWNLIAFENGVLDVETMEFRDWLPTDVIPNVIPHRWNPEARSELLDRVLDKMACGDVAVLCNLTEFIGICMMRSVKRCPVFPVLIGEGANGKSTYIGMLKDVLGEDNISGLQPKDITARFLGGHIVGKTANLGDDIASGYLDDKDCAVIKSVATGDLIFTDVKGGKGFEFEPYCTMVFSCNAFPRLADTTPGFMRRFMPIEFNAVFSPSDPDYDPMIGDKLRDEAVMEYACVLGIEGLRRVIAQNGPTPNEMSESMKGDLAREGNTALQWINDDGVSAEHIIGMTKEEAYRMYTDWAERNGYARTAMASGTLSAFIGTYYRLRCTKSDHRDTVNGRKTVKVYEYKNRR